MKYSLSVLAVVAGSARAQMTDAYRSAIVSTHNAAKRTEIDFAQADASNGQGTCADCVEYEYDTLLEAVAQNYLAGLPSGGWQSSSFQHNSGRTADYAAAGGSGYVGENWYSGAPDTSVHAWNYRLWSGCSERDNYFGVGGCSGTTGHYTQVAWAGSYKVGCGYTAAWGTLCNYSPGGNYGGSDPFSNEGAPCSDCPSSHPNCFDRLCTKGTPCAADGQWPITYPGSSVTLGCTDASQVGNRQRTCNSGSSSWDAVVDTCRARGTDCGAEGDWPAATDGQVVTIDCGVGFHGTRSRQCTNGWFGAQDLSDCSEMSAGCDCTWNAAYPCKLNGSCYSHSTKDSCQNAGGSFCSGGGSTDPCSLAECGAQCGSANADNLSTGTYCTDGQTCSSGQCVGGTTPDDQTPTECAAAGVWVSTDLGVTASVACDAGFNGQQTRACNSNGVWGTIDTSSCTRAQCPANSGFAATNAGSSATKACASGFTGDITRACDASGNWGSQDDSGCTQTVCSGNQGFPSTQAGVVAEIACGSGMDGKKSRVCSSTGTWGTVDDSGCEAANCADNASYSRYCPSWANAGYCTQTYVQFMEENCTASCSLCAVSVNGLEANPQPLVGECGDTPGLETQCTEGKADGMCDESADVFPGNWFFDNCKGTCGRCPSGQGVSDACAATPAVLALGMGVAMAL